jgi:hypothetical protein
MNKRAVLDTTAEMMKKMIPYDEFEGVTQRSALRGKEQGAKLIIEEKYRVNKLIKEILASPDFRDVLAYATEETYDAFVFRYFQNVKYLMNTGAEDIELPGMVPENSYSVWASVMLLDVDCL